MSSGFGGIAAETTTATVEMNQNYNKKILHCYKVSEHEWTEIHEGIFTG